MNRISLTTTFVLQHLFLQVLPHLPSATALLDPLSKPAPLNNIVHVLMLHQATPVVLLHAHHHLPHVGVIAVQAALQQGILLLVKIFLEKKVQQPPIPCYKNWWMIC